MDNVVVLPPMAKNDGKMSHFGGSLWSSDLGWSCCIELPRGRRCQGAASQILLEHNLTMLCCRVMVWNQQTLENDMALNKGVVEGQ